MFGRSIVKARIATLLSLTGVLVAGSAAALVNSQVLSASDNVWASDPMITLAVDSTTASTAATTDSSAPVLPTAAAASAPVQPVYQVGDAALITLDTSGGVLTVASVTPGTGWAVVGSRSIGATDIEVQLQGGNSLVAFRAKLALGVVITSVEVVEPPATRSDPSVATTHSGAPGTTSAQVTTSSAAAPSVTVAEVPPTTAAASAGPATTISDGDGDGDDHDEEDEDEDEDEEDD